MEIVLEGTPPAQVDETRLIRRIAAGEEAALRDLFEVHGQRMYAYALRVLGDPSAADDVVQESLVAVWQGAARYRGDGRPAAWLMGIVHFKALNALRRKPLESLEETENDLPAKGMLPEEKTSKREQRAVLHNAIAHLSADHRAVLELVFYGGMSLHEIAEVLDCPLGTVKSRLAYARASLRGYMERNGLREEME
jgi:RNA polymerase sigma-70 factor (ECF subfamily)